MRDLLQMASELSVITIADVLAVLIARHWHLDSQRKWKRTGPETRDLFGPQSRKLWHKLKRWDDEDGGVTSWALMVWLSGLFVLGLAFAVLSQIP